MNKTIVQLLETTTPISSTYIPVQDSVSEITYKISAPNLLASKANIDSPAFTGVPTAPSPNNSDNSNKIATTSFVRTQFSGPRFQGSISNDSFDGEVFTLAQDQTESFCIDDGGNEIRSKYPYKNVVIKGSITVPTPTAAAHAAQSGTLNDRVPAPDANQAGMALVASDDGTAGWQDISGTANLNGTNYLMVYGTDTPTENGVELLAAYEAAKQMPRYVGIIPFGSVATVYKGQAYTIGGPNVNIISKTDYTGIIQDQPVGDRENTTLAIAKSISTTLIVAPGQYEYSANALNLNATNIHIKSLTGEIDVVLSDLTISVSSTFVSGIEVVSTGFININPNLTPSLSMCKGYFNGESDPLNGEFYRCNFTSIGFSEIEGKLIDCVGNFATDTFGGIAINCRLSAGSFGTPTGSGKLYNCINGDGTLVNYPAIVADVAIPTNANLPGSPTTTTQPAGTNDNSIATTSFVRNAVELDINENLTFLEYSATPATQFLDLVTTDGISFEINMFGQARIGTKITFKNITDNSYTKDIVSSGIGIIDGIDIDVSAMGNPYTLSDVELNKGVSIVHIGGNHWITFK